MKTIVFLLILQCLFLITCGKKDIPPSPDIFPPSIIRAMYQQNNTIEVLYNENIMNKLDSLKIKLNDSIIYPDYFIENSKIIVLSIRDKIDYIDVYGLMDKYENKRDFLKIVVSGDPIKDTIKPYVERFFANDTLIMVYCNELIKEYNIDIYPSYIIKKDTLKNKTIIVHIKDTLGIYPVQFIVNELIDLNDNKNDIKFINYIVFKDTSYNKNLKIDLTIDNEILYLYDYDKYIVRKAYKQNQVFLFEKLKNGKYYIHINDTIKQFTIK